MKRGILLLALLASTSLPALEFDDSFTSQAATALPAGIVLRLVEDPRGYIVSGLLRTNVSTGPTEDWRDVPWLVRLREDGKIDRSFRTRHLTRKGTFEPRMVFRLANGMLAVERKF